jgi:hypothetical protein
MPQILTCYFVGIDEHLKLKIINQTFTLQICLSQILISKLRFKEQMKIHQYSNLMSIDYH